MTRAGKSARRAVSLVTALLLLLCQAAVAAQACGHAVGGAYALEAQPPCHTAEEAGDSTPHGTHAVSACDAAKAVGDAVKIPLADVTDLPALPAATAPVRPLLANYAYARATDAQCHPPPLTRLHCRMLN